MPVGGGTFTVQNKTLPGAYYQFRASGNTVSMGARGIAALPLELPWGPENQIYSLAAGDFNQLALKDLGYDPTASELLLVREALKRAKTLLIYRVNSGGAKAAVTVGGLSVTARYGGTRGNALKAAVLANADNSANVDVVTYLDGTEMDRQTVAKSGGAAGLKANDYVTFSTPATLTAAAAASLTGGTNGTVNGSAYTAWMNALEVEDFNVLGYPGTDDSVKSLVTAFVKRLRDDEGKYITGVLYQHTSADSIGIISVKNGVKLSDGTVITGDKAVAWVTGASASAEVNESLTNTTYDDAVDVDIKYTKGQYEAALKAGEFVFYAEKGKARVLSDINSRTTFGIRKILQTERFQYLIYSWNYGMEWSRLIGKSRETALANLKQQLESALLQDDRILSITDLNVTDSGRRFLTVSFTANTIFGAVGEEITANV